MAVSRTVTTVMVFAGLLALAALLTVTEERSVSASVSADRDALVALYNATDGGNWKNKTNWLSEDAPLGEWHGVTTNEDGRVVALKLSKNMLSGEFPSSLNDASALSELRELRLSFNQLSGEIPEMLGSLTKLEALMLAANQLSGEIPEELGDLTNLEVMFLNNNQLDGEIPEELKNLSSLKRLFLKRNQLDGEIPEWLGQMSDLEQLSLAYNQLEGDIPQQLGGLAKLRLLDLRSNQLEGPIPQELGSYANLESLNLGGNQLTGCVPPEWQNLEVPNDLAELNLPFCVNYAPAFITRQVAENTPSGTDIGAPVAAADPEGATLTYSLLGIDADSFAIDSASGQLSTESALDYETRNTYTVKVTATDDRGASSSVLVTISVTDVAE